MRDGEKVTVRALWAMPGVPDGAVQHVEWGPRLATLVDAGRYEVLAGAQAAPDTAELATAAAAGDVDGEQPPAKRPRRR